MVKFLGTYKTMPGERGSPIRFISVEVKDEKVSFLDKHCESLQPESFCSVAVGGANSGRCDEFHHSQATASQVFIRTA
jgi:hypothetical protein